MLLAKMGLLGYGTVTASGPPIRNRPKRVSHCSSVSPLTHGVRMS